MFYFLIILGCFILSLLGWIIYNLNKKKIPGRKIILCLVIFLGLGLSFWAGHKFTFWSLQFRERNASLQGCESDMLYVLSVAMQQYAIDNEGYYPSPSKEKELLCPKYVTGKQFFYCPRSRSVAPYGPEHIRFNRPFEYEWTMHQYTVNDDPNFMLVWDSYPHGFNYKWRNVIFIRNARPEARKYEHVEESEFRKLLKQQEEMNK